MLLRVGIYVGKQLVKKQKGEINVARQTKPLKFKLLKTLNKDWKLVKGAVVTCYPQSMMCVIDGKHIPLEQVILNAVEYEED